MHPKQPCPNQIEDSERPCGDEGELCPACLGAEATYWASYFGLTPDMSREQARAQLERFNPNPEIEEGCR
jgi:hypothetical protein